MKTEAKFFVRVSDGFIKTPGCIILHNPCAVLSSYRGTLFKDKLKNNNIPHGKTGNGLKWK